MNRRDFLRAAGAGAAGAVMLAGPAQAAHILEPQTPITGIGLRVYQYTNRTPTFQSVHQWIPEDGVQPPNSYPVTVNVVERVNGEDVVVDTVTAYEQKFVSPGLQIDPVTGLPVVYFGMRVEPQVTIARPAIQLGSPSEHWTESLRLSWIGVRNHKKYLWAVPWNHANTAPHARFPRSGQAVGWHETSQANQSLEFIPLGTRLIFEHIMRASESRRVFSQSLTFIIGSAPVPVQPVCDPDSPASSVSCPPASTTTTTAAPTTTTVAETTTTIPQETTTTLAP